MAEIKHQQDVLYNLEIICKTEINLKLIFF